MLYYYFSNLIYHYFSNLWYQKNKQAKKNMFNVVALSVTTLNWLHSKVHSAGVSPNEGL